MRRWAICVPRAIAGACGVLAIVSGSAVASTTGKLSGLIVDAKKQPLVAVNVAIPALRVGAATDADGRFTIQQVPSGTYDVRVSLLGYQAQLVQGVVVSADNTAYVNVTLTEAPIAVQEIVVSAKRPVVDLKLTSSLASVRSDQIAKLPVQNLQEVVNLQAGVVDGHFLGGRLGEVQYQVDGVTVNNPFDNRNSLSIDRSLIEEVQVVTGTFDAEYGQAMSGVVNAVLKRGTDTFQWNAEVYDGTYVFDGTRRGLGVQLFGNPYKLPDAFDPVSNDLRPLALQNYQVGASGPIPFGKTNFIVSARHYTAHDAVYGRRLYTPWAVNVPNGVQIKETNPDGNGEEVPLGWTTEWSGLAKVTNHSMKSTEFSYQVIPDWTDQQDVVFADRLVPDAEVPSHTRSLVHGLDVTHTISKTTFVSASLRQNYFDRRQMKYDDFNDPRYDLAGQPTGDVNFIPGANTQGVDLSRSTQNTNGAVFKSSFTSQIRRDQQIKLGIEYEWPHVQFGSPGVLIQNGAGNPLIRHIDEPPSFPGVLEYRPFITSAYAQDEIEFNDVRIRAGLRFEYFNPRSTIPSDLANPANAIADQPLSEARATTHKISLSPRVGISYPVTDRSAVYFAYGHFYQMPELGQIYGNSDYGVLKDLAQGSISYGVLGNPDVRPQRTVQYQFGYKQSVTDDIGVDANLFFKDIRDLLGVEFVDTYNDATYARLTNVDFGNVIGFTLSASRRSPFVTTTLDYTWQSAQGDASDPYETATRASNGEDPRPRSVPFNWDQRHTLNLTVTMGHADRYSMSGVLKVASGQPYTPATTVGFGNGLETNSGRKPSSAILDVRGERYVYLGALPATLFLRVFNVFDQRFNNGSVFNTSGSPYYSRFPVSDQVALADPTRYYAPRRIEVGVSLRAKGGE